jgi:integrase
MPTKLTDKIVKALPTPASGKRIHYDSVVKGFGCRVYASGLRTFVLRYRTRGAQLERLYTIGSFPEWPTVAARNEAAERKRDVDRGGDPVADLVAIREAPTVSDLCDRFIREYLPRKQLRTRRIYQLQIEHEVRPALGRYKVADVEFAQVDALHRKITARGAPYMANRILALVSRMFTLAIRWQLRSDNNPCRAIEKNREHKRRRYLSPHELAQLDQALDAYSDQQSADIIRLLLLTGARKGEVLAARWTDFEPEFRTWHKPGSTTKQRSEHIAPLSEPARALLTKIRGQVPAVAEWVFPGLNGSHRSDVAGAWLSLCQTAGIAGARVHDLRHTYASVLASSGFSLPIIGQLLGHTMPATTARYTHLYDDPLRLATEQAGAIITGRYDRH